MEDTSTPPSPSLQSRLQVSQLKSEIVEKPHVIAMENQISAYVPRRLILKEVMGQLNLNVHGTGMLPFGLDQYIAWMCVDLPRHGGRGKDGDTVLYSDPFSNHEDAEENLAESVLEYYQSNRKIEINDFNQNVLKKKQYELDISNFFCQAFKDKMDEMRAYPGTYSKMSAEQFYSEAFQDNMTDLIKERTTETNQCKAVHRHIADVCRSFSDILPIKEMCLPGDSCDAHSSQLTFTGDKENPSRVDQLALLLLDILAHSCGQTWPFHALKCSKHHSEFLLGVIADTTEHHSEFLLGVIPDSRFNHSMVLLFYIFCDSSRPTAADLKPVHTRPPSFIFCILNT